MMMMMMVVMMVTMMIAMIKYSDDHCNHDGDGG